MKRAATNCERVSERLAAYHEGWLPDGERTEVERHLAACALCAAEARRDAALVHRLRLAHPAAEVAPAWADVWAKHQGAGLPDVRARGRSLAWAGAAAIVLIGALLFPRPVSERGGVGPLNPTRPISMRASASASLRAHALLAAGSVGGDPNRAMLLAYTSGDEGAAR